jgi:hypothetical protein
MNTRFQICIEDEDRLGECVWTFCVMDGAGIDVVLDRYEHRTRQTTRHKFVTERYYDRLDSRYATISEADAPMTDQVAADAYRRVANMIRVRKWGDKP